jgi:DNA-binding XRE family transcriptional regulator
MSHFVGGNRMTEFERLRVNAGITIVQLAQEADVSRGTIEKIEKGKPVRAVLAARACNALSRHLPNPVTYESLGIKVI